MGSIWTKVQSLVNSFPIDKRVLMLGLDAAGKTTVLYQLKLGEIVCTIPTIGFNVETVQRGRLNLTIFDVGGQQRVRALWRHYTQNTDALIYVVDSSDRDRIEEAGEELQAVLLQEGLGNAVILVLANKQDLPNAMGAKEIGKELGLEREKRRQWFVQPCTAVKGVGIAEGLDWLSAALTKQQH